MRITFRFSWIPFLATVAVVTLGITLGQWQTRRAEQKLAIEVKMQQQAAAPALVLGATSPTAARADAGDATDALEFRRVRVRGQFVRDWPLYLDNRPNQGRAGMVVLMPFKIADSDTHVLVARGWAARDRLNRARLPVYPTKSGVIDIEGVVRRNPGRLLQLGEQRVVPGALLQNLEIADFAAASRFTMQPFIIEQTDPAPISAGPAAPAFGQDQSAQLAQSDQLVRDWPLPSSGIARHRGYAFQWFGLALMAFLFYVITGFRNGTK
jgi:surfeit locus 1 family protein